MINNQQERLQKYAELLVKVGMNVQPKQRVYIRATVDAQEFVHLVVEESYKAGSEDVKVAYGDDRLQQLNLQYRPSDAFDTVPQYVIDERMDYANDGAAQLALISSSPENLKDADPDKVSRMMRSYGNAFKDYMKLMQSDQFSWTVAAYPSYSWAQLVFPELDKEEAFDKLLELMLYTVRENADNPVQARFGKDCNSQKAVECLFEAGFHQLKFFH